MPSSRFKILSMLLMLPVVALPQAVVAQTTPGRVAEPPADDPPPADGGDNDEDMCFVVLPPDFDVRPPVRPHGFHQLWIGDIHAYDVDPDTGTLMPIGNLLPHFEDVEQLVRSTKQFRRPPAPSMRPAPTAAQLHAASLAGPINQPEWYEPGGWGYDWFSQEGYTWQLVFALGGRSGMKAAVRAPQARPGRDSRFPGNRVPRRSHQSESKPSGPPPNKFTRVREEMATTQSPGWQRTQRPSVEFIAGQLSYVRRYDSSVYIQTRPFRSPERAQQWYQYVLGQMQIKDVDVIHLHFTAPTSSSISPSQIGAALRGFRRNFEIDGPYYLNSDGGFSFHLTTPLPPRLRPGA